jgi:hypothetical protein
MVSNLYYDNRFTILFVVVAAATILVLSISLMQHLQLANAIQPFDQSPQSIASPVKLTFTSVDGDLRGSIEGLLSDLSDIAGTTGGQLSGKIASSEINLNNGTVEKVLLGNWSLDSAQGSSPVLLVNFDVLGNSNGIPLNQVASENFIINNLTVSSMQQNDGNTEIGGSVDVIQQLGNQQQQVWKNVGMRLSLANNVLVLALDENSKPGQIFAQSPIVGFITQST